MLCHMSRRAMYLACHVIMFLFLSYSDRMLPVEAFKPRSPPRISPYSNNYQDNYYDDYYGGNQNTAASYSDSNYEVISVLSVLLIKLSILQAL